MKLNCNPSQLTHLLWRSSPSLLTRRWLWSEEGNITYWDICRVVRRAVPSCFYFFTTKIQERKRERERGLESSGDPHCDKQVVNQAESSQWSEFSIIYATVGRIWSEYWSVEIWMGPARWQWVESQAGVDCHLDTEWREHQHHLSTDHSVIFGLKPGDYWECSNWI